MDELLCLFVYYLAQFINLGTTETGSRALGNSFIEVFLQSLQAFAGYICDVFNRFLIQDE